MKNKFDIERNMSNIYEFVSYSGFVFWGDRFRQCRVPAVIDESIVTDVTGTVDDENGVEDAVDEFDVAAVDCDGGAGVVAAVNRTHRFIN